MGGAFTGDPLRDTYIRYHLMTVVLEDNDSHNEFSIKRFAAVAKAFPPEITFEANPGTPTTIRISQRGFHYLMSTCNAATGFPPFQRLVGPPESFALMDAAQRAVAEKNWAEAKVLREKFKPIDDPIALRVQLSHGVGPGDAAPGAWRDDVRHADVRRRRGARYLMGQLSTLVQKDPAQAVELLGFVNAAYFNGWLGQYAPGKLKSAAAKLKSVVVAADKATDGGPAQATQRAGIHGHHRDGNRLSSHPRSQDNALDPPGSRPAAARDGQA